MSRIHPTRCPRAYGRRAEAPHDRGRTATRRVHVATGLGVVLAVVLVGTGAGASPSGGDASTGSAPAASASPGADTTPTPKPILRRADIGVMVPSELTIPVNSRVSVGYRGGNCTKSESNVSFTTTTSPQEAVIAAFTAKSGDPWEKCAYAESNARFVVDILTPGQQVYRAMINVQQVPPVNSFSTSYRTDCQGGTILCRSGGTDTVVYPFAHAPYPRANFGPLKETVGPAGYTYCSPENDRCNVNPAAGQSVDVAYGADGKFHYKRSVTAALPCDSNTFGGDPIKNEPKHCWTHSNKPTPEFSVTCGGLSAKVGDTLKDAHIATADGSPLPTVEVSLDPHSHQRFPPGLTWQRWPTANDSWLVLNGTVTEAGHFQWTFEGRIPGTSASCPASLDVQGVPTESNPPPTTPTSSFGPQPGSSPPTRTTTTPTPPTSG
jgi:hypothetical protein